MQISPASLVRVPQGAAAVSATIRISTTNAPAAFLETVFMKRFLRHNGLSIALCGFFLLFQVGLSIVGQRQPPESKPVDSPHGVTGKGG